MRKPAFVVLVVFSIGFYSCQESPAKKAAQDMSNTFVGINDTVFKADKQYQAWVAQAVQAKDYSKLEANRLQFEQFIDSCGRSVKHMTDTGGSEVLRRSELAVLGFERSIIHNDFSLFEKLKPTTEDAAITALRNKEEEDAKKEAVLVEKFTALQQEYAKKNGF